MAKCSAKTCAKIFPAHNFLWLLFGVAIGVAGGYIMRDTIGRLWSDIKVIKEKA